MLDGRDYTLLMRANDGLTRAQKWARWRKMFDADLAARGLPPAFAGKEKNDSDIIRVVSLEADSSRDLDFWADDKPGMPQDDVFPEQKYTTCTKCRGLGRDSTGAKCSECGGTGRIPWPSDDSDDDDDDQEALTFYGREFEAEE